VIQVHVGQENIVDRPAGDPENFESREQVRHRIVRPDIDEGRTARVLNDVRGCVTRMQILRVHSRDAMGVAENFRAHRTNSEMTT
jgi:hypothetical protein